MSVTICMQENGDLIYPAYICNDKPFIDEDGGKSLHILIQYPV